uniref:Complement C8 gamma chain n=1 Tax=Labrus bergylta TaxID=56723 RepID=A0A3Q3GYI5_9LABR
MIYLLIVKFIRIIRSTLTDILRHTAEMQYGLISASKPSQYLTKQAIPCFPMFVSCSSLVYVLYLCLFKVEWIRLENIDYRQKQRTTRTSSLEKRPVRNRYLRSPEGEILTLGGFIASDTMVGVWRWMLAVVGLMCVCLWGSTEAVGGAVSRPRPQRRPPKKPKVDPIDLTPPAQNIDIQRMAGRWYLLNTASKCSFLINHGTNVEPTVMTLTPNSDQTLSVSTKTRHNHQCWEILQVYNISPTPGKLTLKGSRPELNVDIVIVESDYDNYAIMFYQKRGKITMKLYGRSVDDLSEPMLSKFEQLAEKQNLGLAYLFPFPTYSHCGEVDQDHTISKFNTAIKQ